jgi:hypothetical protein
MRTLNNRFAKAVLVTFLCAAAPFSANAATEWLGSASQWSVGYVTEGSQNYCSLVWDSETGKTAEFREGVKNDDSWIVSNAAWNLPENLSTQVVIKGRKSSMTMPAVGVSKTSLRLMNPNGENPKGSLKAIIRSAVAGTVDLDLDFAGTEPDWVLPTSRIYPLHATFTSCLSRLTDPSVDKTETGATKPF